MGLPSRVKGPFAMTTGEPVRDRTTTSNSQDGSLPRSSVTASRSPAGAPPVLNAKTRESGECGQPPPTTWLSSCSNHPASSDLGHRHGSTYPMGWNYRDWKQQKVFRMGAL